MTVFRDSEELIVSLGERGSRERPFMTSFFSSRLFIKKKREIIFSLSRRRQERNDFTRKKSFFSYGIKATAKGDQKAAEGKGHYIISNEMLFCSRAEQEKRKVFFFRRENRKRKTKNSSSFRFSLSPFSLLLKRLPFYYHPFTLVISLYPSVTIRR